MIMKSSNTAKDQNKSRLISRIVSVSMCACLACTSLAGCGSTTQSASGDVAFAATSNTISVASADASEKTNTGSGSGYAEKEETVYVTTDGTGNTTEITVSDWLKNQANYQTLQDVTSLQDVVNVEGDETFTQSGDNITFDAGGNDIYYQGTLPSSTNLPVS
jgi:putative membrane protein